MTAGRQIITTIKDYCTPKNYVDSINEFFYDNIELDPCWNQYSLIKAKQKYSLPDNNGLKCSWNYKTIYVNPPYGIDKENNTKIKDWLKICVYAHLNYNSEIIALIPVATNTSHWKECVFNQASSICFCYDTRMKFGINGSEKNKGSPMACALIYWGNNNDRFRETFSKFGFICSITSGDKR